MDIKNNSICGIYKITNTVNEHAYVGESVDILRRWKEHKRMNGDTSLYRAFKKYGIENFSFEILELCSKDKLCERERYWISYYNTYNNGYNMTPGGEGGPASGSRSSVAQYDLEGNFIAIYESIAEAERILGIKSKGSQISKICEGKGYEDHGYQWRYVQNDIDYTQNIGKSPLKEKLLEGGLKGLQNREYSHIKIAQCDKITHQIIKIFDSVKEASNELKIHHGNIYRVCNGERQSAGGYYWMKI